MLLKETKSIFKEGRRGLCQHGQAQRRPWCLTVRYLAEAETRKQGVSWRREEKKGTKVTERLLSARIVPELFMSSPTLQPHQKRL